MSVEAPVFLLCGGLGTRFREETHAKPKPMITIGNRPILWHIMRTYSQHGFKRFVLCAGYMSEAIKEYFLNYAAMSSDFTVKLKRNEVSFHSFDHDDDWEVTVADTGELTMTGGRVARAAEKYLGKAENFLVTYGDGLTNADLAAEWKFHQQHGKIGTVLGVNPPSRFGEFRMTGDSVTHFEEKPSFGDRWINGGYFCFRRDFVKYLSKDESCVLERAPLAKLAGDGQLQVFKLREGGYWACMDTQRDREQLEGLWAGGKAPWK